MRQPLTVLDRARELQNEAVAIRRHLHQHPELSFKETETADYLARGLEGLGYEVKTSVGKTGLVGNLGGGAPIALRAELDALPLNELNRISYASKNPGVMHACGHDANMACVLIAARLLKELPADGGVRIIMQPAAEESADESGKAGTTLMIEEGALDGVKAIIALHVDATLPVGKVGIITEPVIGATDSYRVVIDSGVLTGEPSFAGLDAVALSSLAMQEIYALAKRYESATRPAKINIATVKSSSTSPETLSQKVELAGKLYAPSKEMRRNLMTDLEHALQIVKSNGGDLEVEYSILSHGETNSPEISQLLREVAVDMIGGENVITIKRKTWTEDFAAFTNIVPGSLFLLGGEIISSRRTHHSPTFDIDESGLYIGAAILAEAARRLARAT